MGSSLNFAVYSPNYGVISETFIKRHVLGLHPGKTVLLFDREFKETSAEWGVLGPVMNLSDLAAPSIGVRFLNRIKKQLGLKINNPDNNHIKEFLIANNVKVLLCEYLDHSIRLIDIADELGIRIYAHAHGYDVSVQLRNPKWIKSYQKLNYINGVITMSEVSKKRLIGIGIDESLIHVIPYGINLPKEDHEYARNDIVKCISVGRMTGKKAPIYLLESFRRALIVYPNMTLDYIGNGDLMPAVMQYIHAFNLQDKVTLHGSQSNSFVYKYMRQSDIFLQHSIVDPMTGDEEGLPVSILEAMAHGLPVVSTYHAGIPESVKNNVSGYLVEEGDLDGMSRKIVELAMSSYKIKEFGVEGRAIVECKYTWDIEREKLLRLMNLN